MRDVGRMLMGLGAAVFVIGAILYVARGWQWLPGDIVVERKGLTFVFPVVTCIVVSVVLTLLMRFFGK